MLYIELKNGYKFQTEVLREDMDSGFNATLQFEGVKPPAGNITILDIKNNFDEENLSLIKVYKDSAHTDLLTNYTTYKYLNHFSRVISRESGTVVSMTLGATKITNPISVITG